MQMTRKGSIVIVPASTIRLRNGDVDYPYRQDSNFYYLTGFNEPDSVLVLISGRAHGEAVLFCKEQDSDREIWDGAIIGQEDACNLYGMDDSFPISDIDEILPGLIEGCERIYYSLGKDKEFDQRMFTWVNHIRSQLKYEGHAPDEFFGVDHIVHDMRLYKSRSEIANMKKSASIAADAHKRAMEACRPGLWEYQLEAELCYLIHRNNARLPYQNIVGGGNNACVLHYIRNDQKLKDGDLVLIDVGAEYDCYASDITRTFPVNGRFTGEQKALYEIVLEAQTAAIEQLHPGNSWIEAHRAACAVICKGLTTLGILKGRWQSNLKAESYRKFYMHKTGHWLGMDVHDVGDYKLEGEWRLLEPNMVMTVEPGIYIPVGSKGVAKKWHGIGIRIEDDVAITASGNKVLSEAAPKTVEDIERLMAS